MVLMLTRKNEFSSNEIVCCPMWHVFQIWREMHFIDSSCQFRCNLIVQTRISDLILES